MKGFRVLMVAGALFALAPSANALTGAAAEGVAQIGRAIAAGTPIETAAALETLRAAGFEAGAARALLGSLTAPGNRAKVTGTDWTAFANAAKTLSPAAVSQVVAKLETVSNGAALIAEVNAVASVSTQVSVGPAPAQDPLAVFESIASTGDAEVDAMFAELRADDSETAMEVKETIGEAYVVATTETPATCSPGKQAHCAARAKQNVGLWAKKGYPRAGQKAKEFFVGGALKAFKGQQVSYVGHGEVIQDGTFNALSQPVMSDTLNSCFNNGVPLTQNP